MFKFGAFASKEARLKSIEKVKVTIGSVFVVIMSLMTFNSAYQMTRGKFRPGDLCIVTKETYAAKTAQAKHELFDAQEIKDTLGVEQMQQQEQVFYIKAGTGGLVLNTEFDFTRPPGFRSRVRILSPGGAYGEALWIDDKLLIPSRLLVGQQFTLKNGKVVIVKKVNPDGSFEFTEPLQTSQ